LIDNLRVFGDAVRIRRAVANLLDNAIKYTPSGGSVTLVTSLDGGHAVLSVTDTGIGINESELPHIWDRLYRGDQSRSERGLGLGLSLVKAIVELHQGIVQVKSQPKTGSSFSILLPIQN
jgi:signal transduction histidine kinase